MKKILPGTVLILLGLLLMYTTKPTSHDFDDFIDEKFENTDHQEQSGLERLIHSGIDKTIAFQIKETKQYENKIIFSLVSAKELDHDVKYLGIMGMWFPI